MAISITLLIASGSTKSPWPAKSGVVWLVLAIGPARPFVCGFETSKHERAGGLWQFTEKTLHYLSEVESMSHKTLWMIVILLVSSSSSTEAATTCMVSFGDVITIEEIDHLNAVFSEMRSGRGGTVFAPGPVPGSWTSVDDEQSPFFILGDPPRFRSSLQYYPVISYLETRAGGYLMSNLPSEEIDGSLRFLGPNDLQVDLYVDGLIWASAGSPEAVRGETRERIRDTALHTLIHNQLSLTILENTSAEHESAEPILREIRESIREFDDFVYYTREILEGERRSFLE